MEEAEAAEQTRDNADVTAQRQRQHEPPPQCRICFEEKLDEDVRGEVAVGMSHEEAEELVRVCACTDVVHRACLERWLEDAPSRSRCGVCRSPYKRELKPFDRLLPDFLILVAEVARVAFAIGVSLVLVFEMTKLGWRGMDAAAARLLGKSLIASEESLPWLSAGTMAFMAWSMTLTACAEDFASQAMHVVSVWADWGEDRFGWQGANACAAAAFVVLCVATLSGGVLATVFGVGYVVCALLWSAYESLVFDTTRVKGVVVHMSVSRQSRLAL